LHSRKIWLEGAVETDERDFTEPNRRVPAEETAVYRLGEQDPLQPNCDNEAIDLLVLPRNSLYVNGQLISLSAE